ncbi:MAG: DNA polymerase I, partial [Bacteroidetes bacterium]|nr:DNA polymerase I [Bacteroidota bacterium]
MKKKVFLLDAYALIFRSYYAFINRPIRNSKGFNTSAIYGFTNTLLDVIENQHPDYLAVAFDPSGPTFRNEIYREYKANRDETPEDIKQSVPYIKSLLSAFNIPVIEKEGFEADDVIGTLAHKFDKDDLEIYMMTPDKDFGQLINDNIFVYRPGKAGGAAEVIKSDNISEKYGLSNPSQVIDMLALMGDSVDNVPGVQGIGEKTAVKLINEFGSVEQLLERRDELKGKQKEKIDGSIDILKLSKELVTINVNVPVDVNLEDIARKEKNLQAITDLFEELEFRTLKKRVLGDNAPESASQQGTLFSNEVVTDSNLKTIKDVDHTYTLIENDEQIEELLNNIKNAGKFCFDTETTSVHSLDTELVGLALACKKGEAYYVPFSADRNECIRLMGRFKGLFEDNAILKIGQNLKFDTQVLKKYNVHTAQPYFDTMIAHYLLEPDRKHKLDVLAEDYLQYKMVPIEDLIGKKGKQQGTMRNVDITVAKEYACEDADVTYQLYEIFNDKIEKENLKNLFYDIEMPLIDVLSWMEESGVKLHVNELNDYAKRLSKELNEIENAIYEHAGQSFNINSPKQLGDILFDKLKIDDNAKKTKSKQYATNEETLQKLIDKHPVIPKILDYRSVKKLLSTYVEALPKLVNEKTGKIHTTFNQTIAATGRLSSINPNLQNIPIREERGREIRRSFIASDTDHLILSADYSQIELRLMAHLSEDNNMLEAFNRNDDIHTATAAKIYKIDPADVSREMRSKAKTANFGIIYGISAFGLSQRLNIPRTEAKELIDGYFQTFPKVKDYMDQSIEKGRENGYVKTIMGRRRYLKDIHSKNAVVRGVAERNA